MQVMVQVEFKADKKEPLGEMVRRVAAAFDAAGLTPEIAASFCDGPIARGVSAVERALRKHPALAELKRDAGSPPATLRCLSNDGVAAEFPLEAVLALADGVPRSLPFHAVTIRFGHPDFGALGLPNIKGPVPRVGVTIGDSWWVSGRTRLLSALYVVEGSAEAKRLPPPSQEVAVVLAALGKPKKTNQLAVAGAKPETTAPPEAVADGEIVARYRRELPEIMARLNLPHDLPPPSEFGHLLPGSGPLKPALEAAFAPRGYDCRGGQGVFTVRRRTTSHHVSELMLDVGTWSRSVTAMYVVHGPGWRASIRLPVSRRATEALQYPIGEVAQWERIVANLAMIVDELDRTLAAEIEVRVAPAPAWFEPSR